MTNELSRAAFDEAIANMSVQASPYFKEYVFYMHMLSKCRVIFEPAIPAVAGVTFENDHYILLLNPLEVVATIYEKDGSIKEEILGYTPRLPLIQRLGIIKHEMLHIALGHLIRVDDRIARSWNEAADCALDQEITRSHLPDYAIYPDTLVVKPEVVHVPSNQTAECYYELIPERKEGEGGGNTVGGKAPGRTIDDHSIWEEVKGNIELQKEITKNMVEQAGNSTTKSKGTLPSNYSKMLENLTINREVKWEKLLRHIVGNKKANKRKTILRRNRRLPKANWVKGTIKKRTFNLAVISDVSGSVKDKDLLSVWGSIINICETYNTKLSLVQIDTAPSEPIELSRNTKVIERTRTGGTELFSAVQKLIDSKIDFDALVVTTDGELFNNDVDNFQKLRIPLIWLINPKGVIMPNMNKGRMTAVMLKE